MTARGILALATEMKAEYAKTEFRPHYMMRKGEIVRRSYDDVVYTARYRELTAETSPLRTEKVFRSSVSGKMLAYMDLEAWACDFEAGHYISSEEYEDEMGEDL